MECVYCAVRTEDMQFRPFFKGLTLIAGEFEVWPLDLCVLSTHYLPYVFSVCNIPEPLTAVVLSRWYGHTNVTFCTVYTARDIASLNKAVLGIAEGRWWLFHADCTTHAQVVTLQDCIIAKDAGSRRVCVAIMLTELINTADSGVTDCQYTCCAIRYDTIREVGTKFHVVEILYFIFVKLFRPTAICFYAVSSGALG